MQVRGETSVNKLILLFVFDKMESPLSERTLVDMCTSSNDWLNYMDCIVLIHKLKKDGFICEIPEADDPLYAITTEGREALANYYISIPKSSREEISRFVKNNGTKFRYLAALKNDPAIHIPDGDFYLVAHIEENGISYELPDSAIEIIDPFIYLVEENAAEPLNLDAWPLIRSYETTANEALQTGNKALLFSNVPNPFSSVTRIRYSLPESCQSAELQIIDLQGRLIQRLDLDKGDANEVEVSLDGHLVDGIPADRIRLLKAE